MASGAVNGQSGAMRADTPQIVVIGADPAGLMAAERLAASGLTVAVHERMPSVARKFLMAGRGGLNLTHSEPIEAFLNRYGEARAQVAPWLERLSDLGVTIHTRSTWRGWQDDALMFDTPEGEKRERPEATLLALGGASWPRLGSDGAWTAWLETAGVALSPFRPANVGADIAWSPMLRERFAGAPLKGIALRHGPSTVRGEAVIADYGLEGGAVYALSAAIRDATARDGRAVLTLDLKPDTPQDRLAARLAAQPTKASLSNRLRKAAGLTPAAAALLREGGPPPDAPEALAARIKGLALTATGVQGLERAISSAGGVAWNAVDDRLMLKARPGVFVAGEMLDWEAPTGGYLLQASFASGVAAAAGVRAWLASAVDTTAATVQG